MSQDHYELLDAGDGRKLERFGRFILDRPCAQAVWHPQHDQRFWAQADAYFTREHGAHWQYRTPAVRNGWECSLNGVSMLLHPTDFGHVGMFPEHSFGWGKMQQAIRASKRSAQPSVLNLFAYSGGATLAAAQAGGEVCHLDASRKMVDWARDNAAINHLQDAPIRWITDDVQKFLKREIRRGRHYDGIVLDPPSFGRGTNQELFQIDNNMLEVLDLCRQVLNNHPLFVLLTCHTPGYTPLVLTHLVTQLLPPGQITSGEMTLPAPPTVFAVPSGTYAWWTP
ncbi:MAG: class I SAM-dependent methyltransferase [Victivallales bacterium]|nr:class I SAM-dependent methyltransferase [Victivallales bacterium]